MLRSKSRNFWSYSVAIIDHGSNSANILSILYLSKYICVFEY